MTRCCLLLFCLPLFAQNFDEYIEARRKEWNVPGLAVAVVKDGKVLQQSVYGYRDVEKKLPVTRETLFGIGSVTKSLTVLLVSSLVDEGKLKWDKPVREYARDFSMKDREAAAQVTLRDMLSHRTGLARHDDLWTPGRLTRDELFARIGTLETNHGFRIRWDYNNLMYMAAGVIAERVGGKKYEELVHDRLFIPLGWTRANTSASAFEPGGDWAENYEERRGKLVRVAPHIVDYIAPAGGVNASIEEMTRYLQVHLDSGMLEGRRIFPAEWFSHMRITQMVRPPAYIPGEGEIPESYGLGLYLTTHRGHRLVWHTGTMGCYHAYLAYLPDDHIGFVSLQNLNARPLSQLLARHIFDTLLGIPPADWGTLYSKSMKPHLRAKPAARK